ncbi:MAG: CapA family protein [Christensenellaceae bacterium]|nr:CapA family protein [Christensenellaceae bacterium]
MKKRLLIAIISVVMTAALLTGCGDVGPFSFYRAERVHAYADLEDISEVGEAGETGDTVKAAGGTVDISIDEPSVRMAVGEPHKIEYSAVPEGAQIPELFFSSDSEFITVDEEGNITAEYEGEATITVSSADGSIRKDIAVEAYIIPAESIKVKEDMIIGVGETVDVKAVIEPADAMSDIELYSSDEGVFTCDGLTVKGVSKGEAELTVYSVTDESISDTVKVQVTRGPYAPLREIEKNRYTLKDGIYEKDDGNDSGHARIMFSGDLMALVTQQQEAKSDDTYIFDPSFSLVRPVFKKADFVIGNLETLTSHSYTYSFEKKFNNNNPVCNAPSTYLDAVKYAGYDAVVTANNHSCDAGRQGLIETIRRLDTYDILHTGTFDDEDDKRYFIADINGIKTAFMAYTTISNNFWGFNSDEEWNWMMNKYYADRTIKDVKAAKADGAEFIVCYNHWGVEYTNSENAEQRRMAQEMADAGVDLIIGSHTHSLQRGTVLTASDGRKVPCIYSMGNFVSSVANDLGYDNIILVTDLAKNGDTVTVEDWGYIPCRVFPSYEGHDYVIVPIPSDLNDGRTSSSLTSAERRIVSVMGSEIEEITSLD